MRALVFPSNLFDASAREFIFVNIFVSGVSDISDGNWITHISPSQIRVRERILCPALIALLKSTVQECIMPGVERTHVFEVAATPRLRALHVAKFWILCPIAAASL